jgi:DNA-binding MarR family transcriptional regulator
MRLTKRDIENLAEFRQALRRFVHFSERAARGVGLSPQQHQLMLTIKGTKGREWATVGEIAKRLQVSHNGAVTLVTRAETMGLVQRNRSTRDRRVVQVELTRRGEALIRRLSAQHKAELGRLSTILLQQLNELRGPAPRKD